MSLYCTSELTWDLPGLNVGGHIADAIKRNFEHLDGKGEGFMIDRKNIL